VTTRADLDAVENDGIQRAVLWVFNPRVRYTIEDLLTAAFADQLHKRMFGMVWQWAGQRRQRITNIGVEPYQITTKLRDVFDDAAYWHTHPAGGFTPVEVAARLHHRLVAVHPYRTATAATLASWLTPTCTAAAWHPSGGAAST
jgi:fido (protein-threonine AMPylation protein)